MTTGMPELGSKISLISKADIRYEGRLFTVDPQECTIALASVRSFGTEDRDTPHPVPAQSQIYDYILFRGSDIKDIRIVNQATHQQPFNDPAIMQLSVPPSLGPQQFQSHPVLGQMGAPMGQFGQYAMPMGLAPAAPGLAMQPGQGLRQAKPSELIMQGGPEGVLGAPPPQVAPSVLSPPVEGPPPRPHDHASVLDLIGGGTRSTTPASLASRKSPTNDQGVQAGGSRDGAGGPGGKKPMKPIQPPGGQRGGPRPKSRERRDSGRAEGQDNRQQSHPQNRPQNRDRGSYHGGYQNQGGHAQQQGQRQQQHQPQGGWRQPPAMSGPNAGGGGARPRGGRPRGNGYRGVQGQPQPQASKKNMLKFEKDYDFEQANKEYEEIKSKFSKVKLEDGKIEVNGDAEKKEDSGNETGAGEAEQDEDHEVYYDKTKSFFDKISCEAVERAKGKSQRTDWRTERKLNSETFGVAATRRGNFRGRGGFRGGFRGFRGGYRPQRRDSNQGSGQQQQNQQGRSNQQQAQNSNQQQTSQDDSKENKVVEMWTPTVTNAHDRQPMQLTADHNTTEDSSKSEPDASIPHGEYEGATALIDSLQV